MAGRKKLQIPQVVRQPQVPLGIRELDRFTNVNLDRWKALSKDLDELEAILFFGLEPLRRRLREELITAIRDNKAVSQKIDGWARIVSYQYSLSPLSSVGSLTGFGGRFNVGSDIDEGNLQAWPALYLAEDQETAYREKFQLKSTDAVDGLSPAELALEPGQSYTLVRLRGSLENIFDMTKPQNLEQVARVLKKIRMPDRARQLMKTLGISSRQLYMIQNGKALFDNVAVHNWRMRPVQFGLPAPSQILAELIRAAGFEGILYKSSLGGKRCLAVFPDLLSDDSYIELADNGPPEVAIGRLDRETADVLMGQLTKNRS